MRTKQKLYLLFGVVTIVLRASCMSACSVPLEKQGASWFVPVWIDGKGPFRFLLDSGASETVVGTNLAARLQIESRRGGVAQAADRMMDVQEARLTELRLGRMIRRDVPILIIPLPRFNEQNRIEGVLGLDLFLEAPFLIDLRNRCLEPVVDASDFGGGVSLDATVGGGRILFKVRTAKFSEEMLFALDSGASMLVLLSPRASALATRSDFIELTTASGRRRLRAGSVQMLMIGTLRLRNVRCVVMPASSAREEDGLFPINLFSNVLIDSRSNTVLVNVTRK